MTEAVQSNGLCTEELNSFRRRATRLKFASSLMQGIGGATLFGLVSSLVINSAAVLALPTLALFAVPMIGISCIFIGTKCMLEAQLLDQEMGAKMTGAAVNRGASIPTPEQELPGKTKENVLPPGMTQRTSLADNATLSNTTSDIFESDENAAREADGAATETPWTERIASKRAAPELDAPAAKTAPTRAADAGWADALRASATQDADKEPAFAARA